MQRAAVVFVDENSSIIQLITKVHFVDKISNKVECSQSQTDFKENGTLMSLRQRLSIDV